MLLRLNLTLFKEKENFKINLQELAKINVKFFDKVFNFFLYSRFLFLSS